MQTLASVLYVDDDGDDRFLLQRAWERVQVSNPIHFLESYEEAIDYLEGKPPYGDRSVYAVPCLLLVDIHLHRKSSGLDLLRWVRAHPRFHHLPVVIFTGSTSPEDIDSAYAAGANSVLDKPIGHALNHLVSLIKEYWLSVNHAPSDSCGKPKD